MQERHFPRVCRSCQAPMARQEDTCWRCGTQWASEDEPRTTLRVIAGGAEGGDRHDAATAVAVEARWETDRWTNEGGSVVVAAAAPRRPPTGSW